MLQTLVKHYDIGRIPQLRDRVGVLSSHPYTICTVLRVFGRGVESLPSIGGSEPLALNASHMPLRGQQCITIVGNSPVEYVRSARVRPDSLSAFTNFMVDHTAPEQALDTISYGMNRQLREPWRWYFGDLGGGCEYLCILKYWFDPGYDMNPRRMVQSLASTNAKDDSSDPGFSALQDPSAKPRPKLAQDRSSGPVNYAQVDEYMVYHLRRDPNLLPWVIKTKSEINANRMIEAEEFWNRNFRIIGRAMDAKCIPREHQQVYWRLLQNGGRNMAQSFPDCQVTWRGVIAMGAEFYDTHYKKKLRF